MKDSIVLTIRSPAPYARRIQQVALCLDVSVSGLLRASVEAYAKNHPELPPALVEDLLRLGAQIRTLPMRPYEPFVDPASEVNTSAPASVEG